ncbi:MAG: phosphosulfolactate synthase [Thermoplasmata archaeon]
MEATTARQRSRGPFFPADVVRVTRPRARGITEVLDRLSGFHPEELGNLAPYIDVARIGWGLPLLVARDRLKDRIRRYHDVGIDVSTSSELVELAAVQERIPQFLDEGRTLGFDIIEVSAGPAGAGDAQLERVSRAVNSRSLGLVIEVGGRDPSQQLSLQELISQIGRARAHSPRRVSLPAPEGGRAGGIYDADTGIKYDWLRAIVNDRPHEDLLFEAPLEAQQSYLLRELGQDVNLGGVAISSVAQLATERLGIVSGPTTTGGRSKEIGGPPAAKFLFFLLERHRGLDQGQLVKLSRLPRRTVQSALESLRKQGLVKESIVLHDSRRREYRIV